NHSFGASRRNCSAHFSPSSASGGFNFNALALAQARAEFAGHLFLVTILPCDERLAGRAICATRESPRPTLAPVGKQSDIAIAEDFDFADYAITAIEFPFAAAAGAQRVRAHAQRIGV